MFFGSPDSCLAIARDLPCDRPRPDHQDPTPPILAPPYPLPPAFNVEAQESGHPGVRPRVLRRCVFNFEFRGRGLRNREGREPGCLGSALCSFSEFLFRSFFRELTHAVDENKSLETKWFLGHVLGCMQRRSNGSRLVIALLVAPRSKALPAPRTEPCHRSLLCMPTCCMPCKSRNRLVEIYFPRA